MSMVPAEVIRQKVLVSTRLSVRYYTESPRQRPEIKDFLKQRQSLAGIPTRHSESALLEHALRERNVLPQPTTSLRVVFVPSNQMIAEELDELGQENALLFRNIDFRLLDEAAVCCDDDAADRRKALLAAAPIHFLKFASGQEMIVFANPLVLRPSRRWRPPNAKGKRVRPKQRLKAATIIRAISYLPTAEAVEGQEFSMHPEYAVITTSASRFGHSLELSFENVENLKPGDILNPRQPLTKAFDPNFSKLQRDSEGNNCLTDFENISIPLFWPDTWDVLELEHLSSVASWGKAAYETFVHFLEGQVVEELDELIAPERLQAEKPPKGSSTGRQAIRQRLGQCFQRQGCPIRLIVGPYLIFEVRNGDNVLYVLDSPWYGIALRVYRTLEDARDYAQGGEQRARVEADPNALVWPKRVHDPDGHWRLQFDQQLDQALDFPEVASVE
ncbi:MAG: hypothetical protein KDD69_13060 [Bdellovibrionales bacterium]|nr:hypothetical protein [Bdellovibrionales bacterium]